LTDKPNHTIEQPAPVKHLDCLSCGTKTPVNQFHEIPYKTIMSHYSQLMWLVSQDPSASDKAIEWPPDPRVIEAAGGVGFGCLDLSKAEEEETLTMEQITIPPIINHLHPKLTCISYKKYKKDPLFIYKNAMVCTNCYLVYSEFAVSSFNMNPMMHMLNTNPALIAYRPKKNQLSTRKRNKENRHRDDNHASSHQKNHDRGKVRDSGEHGGPNSLGRVPVDPPSMPHIIHDASEAKDEYGEQLEKVSNAVTKRLNEAESGPEQPQLAQKQIVELIKKREDEFFREVFRAPQLAHQHPLLHLISSHKKIENVSNIELGEGEMGHLKKRTVICKDGKKFAGYEEKLKVCKPFLGSGSKKNKKLLKATAVSVESKNAGHRNEAPTSKIVSPAAIGEIVPTKNGLPPSQASIRHQQFLRQTLMDVQSQLDDPTLLTRSILQSLEHKMEMENIKSKNEVNAKGISPKSEKSNITPRISPKGSNNQKSPKKMTPPGSDSAEVTGGGKSTAEVDTEDTIYPLVLIQEETRISGVQYRVTTYEELINDNINQRLLLFSITKDDASSEVNGSSTSLTSVTDVDLGLHGGPKGLPQLHEMSKQQKADLSYALFSALKLKDGVVTVDNERAKTVATGGMQIP